MQEIERVLERVSAVLVCVGAHGWSAWHEAERQAAVGRATGESSGMVVPVLLPGAPEAIELPVALRGHESEVWDASFSADGQRVVTASEGRTARVWKADGTGVPVVLCGHEGVVRVASFSADGQWVITASEDQTARVWRADGTGEPVVLRGHESEVWAASLSSDGQRVVTASYDQTARVWLTDLTTLVPRICRSVGRNLTPGEWNATSPIAPTAKPALRISNSSRLLLSPAERLRPSHVSPPASKSRVDPSRPQWIPVDSISTRRPRNLPLPPRISSRIAVLGSTRRKGSTPGASTRRTAP